MRRIVNVSNIKHFSSFGITSKVINVCVYEALRSKREKRIRSVQQTVQAERSSKYETETPVL